MTPGIAPANGKQKALAALKKLEPFSPVLQRLIASLAQEDVSFARIADLIERDTVLAGNILGLVNSALYAVKGTVNSVRHAVALLGIDKLRNVTLSMTVAKTWAGLKMPVGCSIRQFNLHSGASAIFSDLLARHLTPADAEGAFAGGLFHDIGLLLIALGLPDEYTELASLCQAGSRQLVDCQREVLGFTRAELSAEILATWNLPATIQTGVRYQDSPELDPAAGKGSVPLSRILHVVHRYLHETGISPAMDRTENGEVALESLGLGDKLPALLAEFQEEFAAIQPYF